MNYSLKMYKCINSLFCIKVTFLVYFDYILFKKIIVPPVLYIQ